MNRIEGIKRRVERLHYFQKEVDNTPPNPGPMETGAYQKIVMDELRSSERLIEANALADVEYLLSLNERYRKALEDIATNDYNYDKSPHHIAQEVLEESE